MYDPPRMGTNDCIEHCILTLYTKPPHAAWLHVMRRRVPCALNIHCVYRPTVPIVPFSCSNRSAMLQLYCHPATPTAAAAAAAASLAAAADKRGEIERGEGEAK